MEKQAFEKQIRLKIDEFDQTIKRFKASLTGKSDLEKEATLAVIRKLEYRKRQLKKSLEGISIDNLWEDMKDNLINTYEQATYELSEAFKSFVRK